VQSSPAASRQDRPWRNRSRFDVHTMQVRAPLIRLRTPIHRTKACVRCPIEGGAREYRRRKSGAFPRLTRMNRRRAMRERENGRRAFSACTRWRGGAGHACGRTGRSSNQRSVVQQEFATAHDRAPFSSGSDDFRPGGRESSSSRRRFLKLTTSRLDRLHLRSRH
jgi:hypothetical protein